MKRDSMSLAEIIALNGPMEERKAMGIANVLCSRLVEEAATTEAGLQVVHPQAILLSPDGTIAISKETVPEPVKEAYLPPEYVKGFTSKESVLIYGLGMLLLFLVTGQDKKSGIDTGIKNKVLKNIIHRCTALDTLQRFHSLIEVQSSLKRELSFPRRAINLLVFALFLCAVVIASLHMYMRGNSVGDDSGNSIGYRNGYRTGYENGISDAPGIGIENTDIPDLYGNLSGNLNAEQGAFAVMGKDHIFYTHQGCVYQMDPYTEETDLLSENGTVSNLSCWDGCLYYLTEDALIRMDLDKRTEEVVSSDLWGRFCIYDGTLFIDDEKGSGYLYGIDLKTLEAKQLNAKTACAYLNVSGESLFYADPENGDYLFRCDHDGGNNGRLLSSPCRDIDLCSEKLYCLTTEDNTDGNAGVLVSMDLNGSNVEILTRQPISRFIARESGVFYISAETGYLEWMTPDGKTRYTVCTSAVSDFNLAGRWILYLTDSDNALYRMRTDGSDSVRLP